MQPQEIFTIKESSELFRMSRRVISKHIQKLDSSAIAKDEHDYKIVLRSGVLQLAHSLGNQVLLDRLHEYEQDNDKNINIPGKNVITDKLLGQLHGENKFLRGQLAPKKQDNSRIQKLLNQRQQPTLQANKQIEKPREKPQLTYTEGAPKDDLTTLPEVTETIGRRVDTEKKW